MREPDPAVDLCRKSDPVVLHARPRQSDLKLWYDEPAKEWTAALPIGNGRLGAMVFGGTAEDRYQLNEDSLWCGKPHDYAHDGAAQYLSQIRQLLFEGKQKEAEQLAMEHFMSVPLGQMPYQPFGDLRLTFPGHDKVEDYRRELDLDTAIATTTYRVNGVTYTRQAFASYPDQVIVIRLECDQPGALGFTATLTSPNQDVQTQAVGDDTLAIRGRARDYKARGDYGVIPGAVKFEGRCRVIVRGGKATVDDKQIAVEGANAATLMLAMATSVKSYKDISADPAARCAEVLKKAGGQDAASGTRCATWPIIRRCSGECPSTWVRRLEPSLPTDQRVLEVRPEGGPAVGGPVLPVWAVPDDRQLAAGRPAGQPAGALERQRQPALGQQVHGEHQHRDELLADRADQPERVRRAAVRRPGRHRSDGPLRRPEALQRSRLGPAPQLRPVARGRPDQRLQPRHLADRRRLAVPAPVVALPLHGRQDLPGRAGLSADERRGGVLRGLSRRRSAQRQALADQRPQQQPGDRRPGHGPDDGPPDHPRPVRQHGRGGPRPGRRRGIRRQARHDCEAASLPTRSASTASSRNGWRTRTTPRTSTATSRISGACSPARKSRRRRRSCSRPPGNRSCSAATAAPAGAGRGRSTSGPACWTATTPT